MEGYERINARSWDNALESSKAQANDEDESSWTLVTNKTRPPPRSKKTSQITPLNHVTKPHMSRIGNAQPLPQAKRLPSSLVPHVSDTGGVRPDQRAGHHSSARVYKPRPPDSIEAAETAWRQRKRHDGYVWIPADIAKYDKTYEIIARENRVVIHFDPQPGDNEQSMRFGLWGKCEAVNATKRATLNWLSATGAPRQGSKKYPNVASLNKKQHQRAEDQWREDVQKAKYRQHPPLDMAHASIGHFYWPEDEYRPDEVFGVNYEALDPIRMSNKCYILWISEHSSFRIMGKPSAVKKAMLQVRTACFQVAARFPNPVHLHVLRWPKHAVPVQTVQCVSCTHPSYSPFEVKAPLTSPRGQHAVESKADVSQIRIKARMQQVRIGYILSTILPNLRHYRGHLQLRLRLGKLLIAQSNKAMQAGCSLQEYEKGSMDQRFKASVTHELGDSTLENEVLHRCFAAESQLFATSAEAENLSQVKPVYAADFIFEDTDGDLVLSVEWRIITDTRYGSRPAKSRSTWTRYEAGHSGPRKLVEISLADLTSGFAWAMELHAARAVDETRLPMQLANFAETVTIDGTKAQDLAHSGSFLIFKSPPSNLKLIRQMTRYCFNPIDTDFTLAVTKFSNLACATPSSPKPRAEKAAWSVSLYNPLWDSKFADNVELEVGKCTTRDDSLDEWFPKQEAYRSPAQLAADQDDDNDDKEETGFMQLMAKLDDIECILGTSSGHNMDVADASNKQTPKAGHCRRKRA